MNFLKRVFAPRPVAEKAEPRRLSVVLNERPLREVFYSEHYADVLHAREQWFQNTPQVWRKTS